jgi:hypothetical protein
MATAVALRNLLSPKGNSILANDGSEIRSVCLPASPDRVERIQRLHRPRVPSYTEQENRFPRFNKARSARFTSTGTLLFSVHPDPQVRQVDL